MSTMIEIKNAIDNIGEAFEAYKQTNDDRIEAIKSGKDGEAKDFDKKLARIETDITKFSEIKKQLEIESELNRERIEELEAKASKPGKTALEKKEDEYLETFKGWVKARGQDSDLSAKLNTLHKELQTKKLANAVGSHGGFAVPEQISRNIERMELLFSPVRRLVKVVQVDTSDYKELVNLRGGTAGWVGENGTRSETVTPLLREVTPTHGELYAYPQASDWVLEDAFFNVENWLAEEVAQDFAVAEGLAVIDGSGSNQPTGMLNTDPVTTADSASPVRAAAAYQYIESDTDLDGSPAAPGIRSDSLIDLVYALNSAYRSGASFTMNSGTTASVRKLKDGDGQYLWQPGLQNGQPDRLLGFPVETWEQMPDIADQAFPVAFGNFRRGYVLVDRGPMRMTVDNNITSPGFVKFYIRRREGGHVLNNDAIKFIRTVQ